MGNAIPLEVSIFESISNCVKIVYKNFFECVWILLCFLKPISFVMFNLGHYDVIATIWITISFPKCGMGCIFGNMYWKAPFDSILGWSSKSYIPTRSWQTFISFLCCLGLPCAYSTIVATSSFSSGTNMKNINLPNTLW